MQPRPTESYPDKTAAQQIFSTSSVTALKQTELSLQQKAMFCATALARCQQHGAKSELARHYEVSRPTVYSAIGTACSVLSKHF